MGSADWHSAILCVRLSTQSVCRRRIETTVLAAHWHGPSGSWVPSNPLFATYARRVHNMDLPDSLVWVVLAFVVVTLTTFFVSAISLAFRGKSSLATFSSFLFWPYWLLIALLFLDPHFDEDLLAASLCFVCFVSAVLFAFAAGALAHYPKTAHAVALAAIAALPWIYTSVLRGNIYWNEWIVFNVPDREGRSATFAITSELPSVGGTVEVVSCYSDLSPTSGLKRGRMRARRIPSAAQRHLTKSVRSSFDGSQTSTPGGKI